MKEPDFNDDAAGISGPGPGEQLHRERERQGLTLAQVATELRLTRPQIEALEAEDYDNLPPAPFVRGYLRSYARFIGLEPEPLVERFNADQAEAVTLTSGGEAAANSGRESRAGTLAFTVLGLGVAAALGWWVWTEQQASLAPFGIGGDPGATESAGEDGGAAASGDDNTVQIVEPDSFNTGGADESEIDVDVDDPRPIIIHPELLFPDGVSDSASVAERDAEVEAAFEQVPVEGSSTAEREETSQPEADEGAVDAPADNDSEPAMAASDDEAGTDSAVDDGAEGQGAADADTPEPTGDDEGAEAGAQGPDALVLRVDGDSWVEVYDDRDRRLAYGLYEDGDTVRVRGWGPFEVFLGNARAVSVEYGGEGVDMAEFVRANDTARFLVGAEGVRMP